MPQQKKDDRTLAQKIIASPKTKIIAGTAITGAYVGNDIAKGLRRKAAVDQAIAAARRPVNATNPGIPDPKFDPQTGQKLSMSSQLRAGQTANFVQNIKEPLTNQGRGAAINREVKAMVRPDKLQTIKRSLTNIRASAGMGQPAPARVVLPKREAIAGIIDKARGNIAEPFDEAAKSLTAAKNIKEVRKAVGGMQKVGGVRPSAFSRVAKAVGNKEINPSLTKGVNALKFGGKALSKVVGYGALPLSVGINYLAKREAESFADAQTQRPRTPPANPGSNNATSNSAGNNINEAKYKQELVTIYNDAIDFVEKQDYSDEVKRQTIYTRVLDALKGNENYQTIWKSDAFKTQRSELRLKD